MTRKLRHSDSASNQSQTVPFERYHMHIKVQYSSGNTSIHLPRLQQKTIILLSVIKRIFDILLALSETRALNTKTHNK